VRLLPLAFVRLVRPLHSTSILPDARTGVRPAFPSKSKGVYKDSAGDVKRPPKRDAHRDRSTHYAAPAGAATSNRVPASAPVDNRDDGSGRANDPVDAELLTDHPERAHLAGRSSRTESRLPTTHIL
jgi:hypothetical protein